MTHVQSFLLTMDGTCGDRRQVFATKVPDAKSLRAKSVVVAAGGFQASPEMAHPLSWSRLGNGARCVARVSTPVKVFKHGDGCRRVDLRQLVWMSRRRLGL